MFESPNFSISQSIIRRDVRTNSRLLVPVHWLRPSCLEFELVPGTEHWPLPCQAVRPQRNTQLANADFFHGSYSLVVDLDSPDMSAWLDRPTGMQDQVGILWRSESEELD